MINPNWHRWIFASICKHFNDNKGEYALLVEGQDQLPETLTERAELRVNGPFFNELYWNTYNAEVDINVVLNVTFSETDLYRQQTVVGFFAQAFTRCIPVYKYGNDANGADDGSYLGYLVQKNFRGDDVTITNYGQVSIDIRLTQSTIDAIYRIEFLQGTDVVQAG